MFFICDRLLWDFNTHTLYDPEGDRTIHDVHEIQTVGLSTKWSGNERNVVTIEANQSIILDLRTRLYVSMTETHGLIIGPVYT